METDDSDSSKTKNISNVIKKNIEENKNKHVENNEIKEMFKHINKGPY